MKYQKTSRILIKNHPEITEKLIQEIIAEDPQILGLGDLVLKDIERIQPHAGRLDLLLQDSEQKTRYEVELQLGKTDESHIIRTLEYWDIERKRYPQYDHIAVIIAEDITSRFLNIIGLFNGSVPIIGIQMTALEVDKGFTLDFTTVLGLRELGFVDDDEDIREVTDRNYWENRGTKTTMKMADTILEYILEFNPEYELKYNKHYIGLIRNGIPNNFVTMKARKKNIQLELKHDKDAEIDSFLEENDFDLLEYNSKWKLYRMRLNNEDIIEKKEIIKDLLERSYKYSNG